MTRFVPPLPAKHVEPLSPEQIAMITARLACPPEKEDQLINEVIATAHVFLSSRQMFERWPTKKETKARAKKLHKLSRELKSLLQDEWFENRVLGGSWRYVDETGNAIHSTTIFLEVLATIQGETERMLCDQGLPFAPPRKSVERLLLWDPLITIWHKAGRAVRYSEEGPLEQFICSVQEACGSATPSGHSLRQAVEEWGAVEGNKITP